MPIKEKRKLKNNTSSESSPEPSPPVQKTHKLRKTADPRQEKSTSTAYPDNQEIMDSDLKKFLTELIAESENRQTAIIKSECKAISDQLSLKLQDMQSDLNQMQPKIDKLEASSRSKNVVIHGIPESDAETWKELETAMEDLSNKLN